MKSIFLTTATVLFVLVAVASVEAQSRDQDKPTRLTSNLVSGTVTPDMQGNKYYYSFVAVPGDLTVTLTAEADRGQSAIVQVGFMLFDDRDVQIGSYKLATPVSGGISQAIENVTVKRGQQMIIMVQTTQYSNGQGKYRLRITGDAAADIAPQRTDAISESQRLIKQTGINGDDPSTQAALNSRNQSEPKNIECLPKRGTLIVKMKDGSKKIIDLTDAETVTVVP